MDIHKKATQKERDDARCMARIKRECADEFQAIARRNERFAARSGNRMQHPKWRKAAFSEVMRKVETEWHMHGASPTDAGEKLLAELYA